MLAFLGILLWQSTTSETKKVASGTPDLLAFVTGATILKESPRDLYNLQQQQLVQEKLRGLKPGVMGGVLSFRNPPIVAALFLPYTYLNVFQQYRLQIIVNFILQVIIFWLLTKRPWGNKEAVFWIVNIVAFLPILANYGFGQISFLLVLIYIAIYKSLKNDNSFQAGVFTGLLFIKIQYLIIIPWLLLLATKKLRFLTGLVVSLTLMVIVNSALYGIDFLPLYLKFLVTSESSSFGTDILQNYSIPSIMVALHINEIVAKVMLVSSLFVIALVQIYKKRFTLSKEALFSGITVLGLTLNIHTMAPDLTLLLIPITFLYYQETLKNGVALLILFYFLPWLGLLKLQWIATIGLTAIGFYFLSSTSFKIPKLASEISGKAN